MLLMRTFFLNINKLLFSFKYIYIILLTKYGDWGLGIGDWGLGIGPNPQSPIPNPQSPYFVKYIFLNFKEIQIKQF
jgi:hypothetical protein